MTSPNHAEYHGVAVTWPVKHLRAVLAAAALTIALLGVAVVLLATRSTSTTTVVIPSDTPDAAQVGARLDHRGLRHATASTPDPSQVGARLDHRGLSG